VVEGYTRGWGMVVREAEEEEEGEDFEGMVVRGVARYPVAP